MDSDSDSDSNPVLELRMKKECFLKNAQEALSVPFSTANFDFSSTGLVLKARDTSGGAYAVLHLSSKAFDYYSCDHKHFSVDLNLATVSKIFSFANNNDIITIKFQLEDGLTLNISLGSPGSHVISCFHLDVELNANGVPVGVPECLESIYQAIVCMPSAKFKHFCDKLSCDTGDRNAVITISVDKDNVRFFTDKSSEIVHLQTQNGDKPNEAPHIVMKEKISLTFSLRYLKNFSKASTLSDQVTIKLSPNLLVVECMIAEMGYIRYHVMPGGAVISDLDFDFMGVNSMPENLEYLYEYPEYLYDAIVRMPSAKFMHFCNKLSSFWDTGDRKTAAVCISVDKDRVSFSTDGEFKSSTIVCLQTQNNDKPNEATCIEMKKKISLTFDLRYLKNFSNASTLSDQVTIKLSPNLTSVFESKTANMGYIRYRMMSDSSDSPAPPPLCHCPLVMPPATILELRMEEATFLKNLLEVLSLSGLFSKANFKFSSTGLELQATDTCCFALVVLQLRSKAFNSYICNNNGLSVGLILADMAKASSFANNNDIITIEAQDGVEAVVIKFNSPDGSVIQNFKLNFVSINDVPVSIPEYQEFQYEAIIRMPSAEFMHICNQLSSLTDMETAFVCISVDKDRVQFFTDGIHGYLTIECQLIQTVDKSKEATYIEVKMKENVSLTFGLRYMSSLCKAYTLSQQVTIKLSSKLPAVFEYNIAEKGYIRYHVMPAEITEMQGITEEDKDAELMTSGDKHDPFAYFAAIA